MTYNKAFPHRKGQDCITSAMRNLIEYYGLNLREEHIFGIGEGLFFWYCDDYSQDSFPVFLGQNPHVEFTLAERLGLQMELRIPGTIEEIDKPIELARSEIPVLVKADPFYLEYYWDDNTEDEPREHFGEHVLLIVSANGDDAWVSDIWSDELLRVPLDQIKMARSTLEGYDFLLPRNRWYEINPPQTWPDLKSTALKAVGRNCATMLEGRGKFGIAGMRYASKAFPSWIDGALNSGKIDVAHAIKLIVQRMNEGGFYSFFRRAFFEFVDAEVRSFIPHPNRYDELRTEILTKWGSMLNSLLDTSRRITHSDTAHIGHGLQQLEANLNELSFLEYELCDHLIRHIPTR